MKLISWSISSLSIINHIHVHCYRWFHLTCMLHEKSIFLSSFTTWKLSSLVKLYNMETQFSCEAFQQQNLLNLWYLHNTCTIHAFPMYFDKTQVTYYGKTMAPHVHEHTVYSNSGKFSC